ncbi:Lrp/AsnC family transcriptional regulator [Ornithinimicrobium cavernae]|uniref:Lrp/AsnC family transcriptional regulator n=1 Tax=Ornithinimicrobium cavernae TaxID=2666047 RepID=UPI00137A617E|nr:Lrp/AsnC family transcriptional regulator [Ornithinimicrobium cavernae]
MLDELDHQIVAALQVDGRAPWVRIARALGEQERTVSRRGRRLLSTGEVQVTGMTLPAAGAVVGIHCEPGRIRVTGRALAGRADTIYSHALTGHLDVVAHASCPPERIERLVLDELPAVPGVREAFVWPVLRYVRTVHQWRPGLLSPDAEALLLEDSCQPDELHIGSLDDLDRTERTIVEALQQDARRSYEELARLTGLSEATLRRRLDRMRRSGRLLIRAVVDPVALGYPAKAFLWVRTKPADVQTVADSLERAPFVRYATRIAGDHQFVVEVAAATMEELDSITTGTGWSTALTGVDVSVITTTFKRSGLEPATS